MNGSSVPRRLKPDDISCQQKEILTMGWMEVETSNEDE